MVGFSGVTVFKIDHTAPLKSGGTERPLHRQIIFMGITAKHRVFCKCKVYRLLHYTPNFAVRGNAVKWCYNENRRPYTNAPKILTTLEDMRKGETGEYLQIK